MSNSRLTFELLLAYAAGELTPGQAAEVAAKLAADPEAARRAAQIRATIEALRTDDTQPAPPATRAAAVQLFRPRGPVASAPGLIANLRRIVADLVFDSRAQPALAGLRGAGRSYQLSYTSEPADVDLDVTAEAEQRQVRGQVSVTGAARAIEVRWTRAGSEQPLPGVTPDEHGAFAFRTPPGNFELQVRVGEDVVVLANLEIN